MTFSLPALGSALVCSAFLLTACGGGGTTTVTTNSTPSASKTTPPEKVDFNLPSTLITANSASRSPQFSAKLSTFAKDDISNSLAPPVAVGSVQSYAYEELKGLLSDANLRRLETNISLVYLNGIWPQIEQNCASVAVDERCDIPANTVSFTYTQAILDAEYALYESETDYFTESDLQSLAQQLQLALGLTFNLGEINYTVHSNGDFVHDVTIDLSTIEQLRQSGSVSLKQQAKWNADKTRVFTGYFFSDGNGLSISSLIDWDKSLEVISYQETAIGKGYKNTFKSKVSSLNDGKNGVSVDSTWSSDDSISEGTYIYTSAGRVNDEGGHLESSNTYLNETFHNEETFDGNGQRTGGKYCISTVTDCSDKNNWTDDSFFDPIEEPLDPVLDDSDLVADLVSVTGLPADVEFFVIINGSVTTPDFDDVLCFGSNFQHEGISYTDTVCWSDRVDELDANATVFQEIFNEEAAFDEAFLSYVEIPSAVVSLVNNL